MSDFIAFDWERHQLACAVAHVSKGRVRLEACFRLDWPQELDPETQPDRAGAWLKDELRRRGVSVKHALVSLPREDAVVRRLELPNAPDDELPDLVRMQAATKSSSALDQLLLDFLPLPQEPGAERREVLMTTIPAADGARLRKAMQAAGLELESIGISPVGAAEIAIRVERHRRLDTNAPSLVVARHGTRVEISLVRREHLVFTHSALLEGGSEERDNQAILAEVTRATVAQQRLLAGGAIARAWVLGTEAETRSLCEALRARLSCEAETIDPLVLVETSSEPADFAASRASLAGPIGMLLARSQQTVAGIDFLHPRKPVPKTDQRKVQLMVRGGLAAAAVLAGLVWLQMQKSSLDRQIENYETQLRELNQTIEEAAPEVAAAGSIGEWDRTRVDWLAEMRRLNEILPGTDRLYMGHYKFEPVPARATGVGKIEASVFAKSDEDIRRLRQRLSDQDYLVDAKPITQDPRNQDYPSISTLEAALLSQKAGASATPAGQRR